MQEELDALRDKPYNNTQTVSYTHLDVYKRQILNMATLEPADILSPIT